MMSPKDGAAKQEVPLEPEIIKLIKVLIEAKIFDITELPGKLSITYDEENTKVVIAGDDIFIAGDDTFIDDVATSMQRLVSEMAYCKVSQGDGFLCTTYGEKWIENEFKEHGIPAIICTKDRVTYILAKDKACLDSATTTFDEIVTSQVVELDEPILHYLESSEWSETVKGFSANYMVQVISDFRIARILVKGRIDHVSCVIGHIKRIIDKEKSRSSEQLPLTNQSNSADHKISPFDETSVPPNVIVVRGDIATFAQADVLVNTIAAKAKSLEGAGSVSKSFLKAGGEKLKMEFSKSGAPMNFGTDVTVTGTTGRIQAKKIFHAAIDPMQSEKSLMLLSSLIKTCLRKAEKMELSSIAFPTLGCGLLKYNQPDVSRCFAEAAKGSRLKIYIVAYDQDLYEKFKNHFRAQEPADIVKSTSSETHVPVVQELPPAEVLVPTAPVFAKLVFKSLSAEMTSLINPPRTVATVIEEMPTVHPAIAQLNDEVAANIQSLQSPHVQVAVDIGQSTSAVAVVQKLPPAVAPNIEALVSTTTTTTTTTVFAKVVLESFSVDLRSLIKTPRTVIVERPIIINHTAIAQMNDEAAANIQSLQSPDVQISIDKSKSTITLTGAKDALDVTKQIILKALSYAEILQKQLSFVKKHLGVKAIPEYWKICGGQVVEDGPHATNSLVSKRLLLVKSSPVYNAVELLVKGTWDPTRGGALSGINVTKIWIVVNQNLFRNYQTKLKLFASRAAEGSFKAITDHGQSEIITKTVKGTDVICEQLVSEVNEAYLCHGTKYVDEIEITGIDSRLGNDSGLFGRGAYFAESSTKSDQYAKSTSNPKAKRYMFVARVLLGEPFLCKETDDNLKRAPCMNGCKDSNGQYNCKPKAGHSMCDSVFGTGIDLREFIVYSPDQSYPEFLVEYTNDN